MRSIAARLAPFGLLSVLSAVLLAPMVMVVRNGFMDGGQWTAYWLTEVWSDPLYRAGLLNSVLLAAAVTLLSFVISLPLALIADSFSFAGRSFWVACVQLPLVLPPFVGALGLKGILSRNGGINACLSSWGLIDPASPIDWLANPFWTCVVLETLYLYPIMYLNLQAALANIDPAMEDAAKDLGAGAVRRFFSITLPLIRPGAFAGGTIVFIWAFSELGTPLMVGYRKVTAVQVFDALQTTNPEGDAYALVALLLGCSVAMYGIGRFVLGQRGSAAMARGATTRTERSLSGLKAVAAGIPFLLVGAVAAVPHLGVVLMSFSSTGMLAPDADRMTLSHYQIIFEGLRDRGGYGALPAVSLWNSLWYSGMATVVSLVLGTAIAYLAVRRPGKLTTLLDSMAMLPLAVPGLVMAFGYFALTQSWPLLSFLDPIRHDPTPLLVIAYAVRRLPFAVRSCSAGLEQIPPTFEEAAQDLGAGRVRTFVGVTLPLLVPNLIVAGLLVFSRSMLEVSDSLLLAFDRETYPLTKAIWALSSIPQNGIQIASALGCIGMVLLAITMGAGSALLGRRLGALFRV